MLERRDLALKEALTSRDQEWLNGLHHCMESVRLITLEQINDKELLKTIGKRQRELTKVNAEILDWVMKIVSGKKKVPLPQIRISDCTHYSIVPRDVTNPVIPFSNPDKGGEIPFTPWRLLPQDETYGTIGISLRTLEEIEVYKRKQDKRQNLL